jgi:hypothetical protein
MIFNTDFTMCCIIDSDVVITLFYFIIILRLMWFVPTFLTSLAFGQMCFRHIYDKTSSFLEAAARHAPRPRVLHRGHGVDTVRLLIIE